MSLLFEKLIKKIVSSNGAGHKELEQRVASGEIEEKDAARIRMHAALQLLKIRTDSFASNVDQH